MPVADYDLHSNSVVTIVANTPEPSFKNTEHAQDDSIRSKLASVNDTEHAQVNSIRSNDIEHAQVDSIRSELATVNALLPDHTKFLSQLTKLTPLTHPALVIERNRLSELFLQALLRLDAFMPEHDWANARAHRKSAVIHVQSLLDQIDSEWALAQKAQYNHGG